MKLFTDTLRDLRQGRTLDELTEKLGELVAAVEETRCSGELTLTLKLRPDTKGPWVHVEDRIKVKVPEPQRDATLFWPIAGMLSRKDPRQVEFDLKMANKPAPSDAAQQEESA